MAPGGGAWHNEEMDLHDDDAASSFTSAGGHADAPPATAGRRLLRALGWFVAIIAVPLGLLVSWTLAYLGNCKLGFFGDVGPIDGAERVDLGDVTVQSIGWWIAVVPWALVAWRSPRRRRTALTVIGGTTVVFALVLWAPQLLDGAGHWSRTCT